MTQNQVAVTTLDRISAWAKPTVIPRNRENFNSEDRTPPRTAHEDWHDRYLYNVLSRAQFFSNRGLTFSMKNSSKNLQ